MDSLEFRVLDDSIPNTAVTVLIKAGILEPPPSSSILEIGTPR
jgi:hypothetical protein